MRKKGLFKARQKSRIKEADMRVDFGLVGDKDLMARLVRTFSNSRALKNFMDALTDDLRAFFKRRGVELTGLYLQSTFKIINFNRLKHCINPKCGRQFFAKRSTAQFCPDCSKPACYAEARQSKRGFKEARRRYMKKYMRDYRKLVKSGKVRTR